MISPEDWRQWSALLDEALELDNDARSAWLARLQREQPQAAAALTRLLGHHDAAPTPPMALLAAHGDTARAPRRHYEQLLQDVLDDDGPDSGGAQAGQTFGAWQLLRRLGSGGMGEVWLAQRADALYRGEAAIKLLATHGDARRLAARFARERQLLAQLHHPGIARLLDAGLASGQPYLVLEYVEGRLLLDHARAQLPLLAERLRLAVAIGRAVEYAHSRLIVHRDLKPSNLMVGASGDIKLLDFGIAALLEDDDDGAGLTRLYGQGLTLDYAAPEQISGASTGVGCDVYSLGVILFELIAGQRPLRGERPGRAALEHAVLHQDAPRLSRTLATALPDDAPAGARPQDAQRVNADLDAIVAKALRKEPAERYPTMSAFIGDLEHWLGHRPVSAGRDDSVYRARLWLRRNRTIAALATAALLSLTVGLSVSLLQLRRALAAEAEAASAAQEARRQAEYAELRREFAFGLLSAGDVAVAGPSADSELSLKMLDLAASRIDSSFANQPFLRAQMRSEIGSAYHNRGLFARAITLHREAIQLYESSAAPRGYLSRALGQLGDTLDLVGDQAGAEQSFRRAIAIGPTERADNPPDGPQGRDDPYANALMSLGFILREQAKYEEAIAVLERSVARYRQTVPDHEPHYLQAQGFLSQAYRSAERYEEALAVIREQRRSYQRAQDKPSNEFGLALVFEGRALLPLGRFAEAAQTFDQAYAVLSKTLGAGHSNSNYTLTFCGEVRMEDGRYLEAEALLRDSLRRRLAEPEGGQLTFNTRWRLALNAMYRGDFNEAERQARQHLAAVLQHESAQHPLAGHAREVLGAVLIARAHWDDAIAQLQQAVAVAQAHFPPPSLVVGRSQTLLATALSGRGRHDEALPMAASAGEQLRRKMGQTHYLSAAARLAEGRAQLHAGRAAVAVKTLQLAVDDSRASLRDGHPAIGEALLAQAQALQALGRTADAAPLLREAATIFSATPGLDPARLLAVQAAAGGRQTAQDESTEVD